MSSEVSIRVEQLGKRYHVYEKPAHRLRQMFSGRRKQYFKVFPVLDNISFEIKKGKIVGIIGRNGSGKSTLLQMICGTLNPISGRISTHGCIAALLELGSGFNPEFTGRENIYLNGALLGLSTAEIDQRFAAIEAFAELGEYIDQPVKSYSSGMYVRLTPANSLVFGYIVKNFRGEEIAATNTRLECMTTERFTFAGELITVEACVHIPVLHPGQYSISVGASYEQEGGLQLTQADRIINAIVFGVTCDKEICAMIYVDTRFSLQRAS